MSRSPWWRAVVARALAPTRLFRRLVSELWLRFRKFGNLRFTQRNPYALNPHAPRIPKRYGSSQKTRLREIAGRLNLAPTDGPHLGPDGAPARPLQPYPQAHRARSWPRRRPIATSPPQRPHTSPTVHQRPPSPATHRRHATGRATARSLSPRRAARPKEMANDVDTPAPPSSGGASSTGDDQRRLC